MFCTDLSADDIGPGKQALWQWRNRFMVVAQVPIIPRATVEDSSRRILQDEIEIGVSSSTSSR